MIVTISIYINAFYGVFFLRCRVKKKSYLLSFQFNYFKLINECIYSTVQKSLTVMLRKNNRTNK